MKSKRKVARRRVGKAEQELLMTRMTPINRDDARIERMIRRIEDATDALNRIDSALRTLHTLLDKRL